MYKYERNNKGLIKLMMKTVSPQKTKRIKNNYIIYLNDDFKKIHNLLNNNIQ